MCQESTTGFGFKPESPLVDKCGCFLRLNPGAALEMMLLGPLEDGGLPVLVEVAEAEDPLA